MYESFYGLKEKPFSLLPDPAYLYLSKQHEMAIALLQYSLENQAGFCVISGKAGTGKTTLLRRLLNQIGDDVSVGLISNTHHSFGELLRWILHAFDLQDAGMSRAETHKVFIDYLIAQYAKNRRTMLIIDEAQNMAADALEELRMLSNINSEKDLLLQVILVGQPPLRDILRRPELEQFAQRIAVDYHLDALGLEETRCYIRHRIVIAGGEHELFTEDACDAIYEYCGGNPRLINLLCDLSLVYAYASQAAVVTGELVEQVVTEREKYGALPLFATTQKPRVRQSLSSMAVETVTAAMTSVATTTRVPPKTVAFRTMTDVRRTISTEARNKATRLSLDTSGDPDRTGKTSQAGDVPVVTGSRAGKTPAADKLGAGQAGNVDISSARVIQQQPGAESTVVLEKITASVRHAEEMPTEGGVEVVARVEKPVAMSGDSDEPDELPDLTLMEKTPSRAVTVDGAPPRKPDDLPARSLSAGGGKQKTNDLSRNAPVKSERAKFPDVHETKSKATSGQIANGNLDRPASGPRRYIPAVMVVGLLLAAPLVWHFAKQQSAGVRTAPSNASPSPIVAAAPVAVAAPEKVMPSSEPPVAVPPAKEISPVNKPETEAAAVKKDLDEKARLKSVERERDAAQARAKAAEREREALQKARLAQERVLAAEHEAALARERERANLLAQAAEKARQEASAAEAARLAEAAAKRQEKKPEPVPASPTKLSADAAVSRPAGPEIAPSKASSDAASQEKTGESTAFTANPCKGPSARFLSTCE